MKIEYNIYCDESCHLQNDAQKAMVLGAMWCPKSAVPDIFERIREIKEKHNLNKYFEIKWNKVSPNKSEFYEDLIDFYFDIEELHFRALVVPDKGILDHAKFNQSHDDFYYKMFFDLLKVILGPEDAYYIYLDIKDTKSQNKINKLMEILRNNKYDYSKQIIRRIQNVRSNEVELIQLTDLLIGAISYLHRGLNNNKGKIRIIEKIRHRSKYTLLSNTLYKESKMNIFIWKPKSDL